MDKAKIPFGREQWVQARALLSILVEDAISLYLKKGGTRQPDEHRSHVNYNDGDTFICLRDTHGVVAMFTLNSENQLVETTDWPKQAECKTGGVKFI